MGIFRKNKIKIEEENVKTPVKFRRRNREKTVEQIRRRKIIKRTVIITLLVLILGGGGFYGLKAYNAVKKIFAEDSGGILSLLSGAQSQPLRGESSGRVNILMLGVGGENHGGEDLSDTIMIASYDVKTKAVAMISIPRDLYVKIPNRGYSKINAANAYGEQEKKGTGMDLARQTVEGVVGVPINYSVRIDFAGFKDIVDSLGGVSVEVENSFCDYDYPVELKGDTRTVCFTKGKQNMNGTKALQFARSRHALGVEGSDFARSKRQQRLLVAIKEKALSQSTYLNPKKMLDLLTALGNHIKTDFLMADMVRISELAKVVDTSKIINRNFDNSPEGLLVSSTSEAGYILQPRTGNFKEIQAVVKNIFNMVGVKNENASVYIYNGTWSTGLATTATNSMKADGYNVTNAGNADTKNYSKTQIIDYTGGKKPETIKALENKFGVKSVTGTSDNSSIDIKVIIGKDYQGT